MSPFDEENVEAMKKKIGQEEKRKGPFSIAFMWLVRGYQRFISPLFPNCCRYFPTCSAYALEAVSRFGFFKGIYLSAKRILRCNPFFKGGIDKVPQEFSFFKRK